MVSIELIETKDQRAFLRNLHTVTVKRSIRRSNNGQIRTNTVKYGQYGQNTVRIRSDTGNTVRMEQSDKRTEEFEACVASYQREGWDEGS